MKPAPRVRARAFAKLNLHLEVLGRRPDGCHEILSLFQVVDLCDRLELAPARDSLRLRVLPRSFQGVSDGPDNLVLRALEELRRGCGVRAGADVRLWKRIPVGAGLGGGSADAAAALLAGSRLWNVSPSPGRLRAMARRCALLSGRRGGLDGGARGPGVAPGPHAGLPGGGGVPGVRGIQPRGLRRVGKAVDRALAET